MHHQERQSPPQLILRLSVRPEHIHPTGPSLQHRPVHRVHARIHLRLCALPLQHSLHVQEELNEQTSPLEETRTETEGPIRSSECQEPPQILLSLLLFLSNKESFSECQPAQAASA